MNEKNNNKAIAWMVAIGLVVVLGMCSSGTSSKSKSKPAVGTDECRDAQVSHPIPNGKRIPTQREVDETFAELGSLCE